MPHRIADGSAEDGTLHPRLEAGPGARHPDEIPDESLLVPRLRTVSAPHPVQRLDGLTPGHPLVHQETTADGARSAESPCTVDGHCLAGSSPPLDTLDQRNDGPSIGQHTAIGDGQAKHLHAPVPRRVDQPGNLQPLQLALLQQAHQNLNTKMLDQSVQVFIKITFPPQPTLRGRVLPGSERQSNLPGQVRREKIHPNRVGCGCPDDAHHCPQIAVSVNDSVSKNRTTVLRTRCAANQSARSSSSMSMGSAASSSMSYRSPRAPSGW